MEFNPFSPLPAPAPPPWRPRPSLLRRLRVPLIFVGLPLVTFGVMRLWDVLEMEPAARFPLFMAFQLSVTLALVVIPIWFLFFSGLSWVAKANGVAALILLGIVTVACVRRVEFTGDLRPVFIFRWQPRPEDRFEQYRSRNVAGTPLPPIDLTIDPVGKEPWQRKLQARARPPSSGTSCGRTPRRTRRPWRRHGGRRGMRVRSARLWSAISAPSWAWTSK